MWRTAVLGLVVVAGLLAGCGDEDGGDAGTRKPSAEPRPAVFAPDELVWAARSKIHVGARTFDVAPRIV